MGYTAEGKIEIDMDEFWAFLHKYVPYSDGEYSFGVPRVNQSNCVMEIDFAVSSEGSPDDWVKKPKSALQWKNNDA